MKKKTTTAQRVAQIVSNNRFFAGILVLFGLQALWLAFSGRYPMAFDEDFHLGLIKLYSHHVSPFWEAQPSGADAFGAVVRDPSYLYHYLMSFPYRVVSSLTDSLAAQVICLRIINIALFGAGLVLWRRLLLKTGGSRAVVHICLLLFVLLPVVPLLAAQINYDNLFMPVVAMVLLLTANFGRELRSYKRVSTKLLLQITLVGLLASLVKYAFLPVLIALMGYVLICLWQSKLGWRKVLYSLAFGWTLMTRTVRWSLLIAVVVVSGLFAERYLVNIARYHAPVPDCAAVLSEKQCGAYGPWARNHYISQNKDQAAVHSPLTYTADWFYGMWLRTFFAVDGPGTNFETRGPLVIPGIGAIVLAATAVVCVLVSARQLWRRYDQTVLTLFLVVLTLYIGLLAFDGYQSFTELGQTVAINGRYLLPVALPGILIGALGVNEALGDRRTIKITVATVAVIALAWGGGGLTYVLRSRAAWYWPNSTVVTANRHVRETLGPAVPGYRHPIEFMSRN